MDTEKRPVEDWVARPFSVHDPPERRWTTTTRPARTGYPYPDRVNPSPVSAEAGADSDRLCLTTDRVRVTDIAWAAAAVGRASARQDVLDSATPATTEVVKRPVELVTAEATVDHDDPYRCNHTVRPAAAGETTPDMTTDSTGAATDGLTPSDTVDATTACAEGIAPSGHANANTAANTTSNRQRDGQPSSTPNPPTTNLLQLSPDLPGHPASHPRPPRRGPMMAARTRAHTPFARTALVHCLQANSSERRNTEGCGTS